MNDQYTLNLELICVDLPEASAEWPQLRLGLQHGRGVEEDVPCTAGSLQFTVPLQVCLMPEAVLFSGDYAHGSGSNRFVYLCWGERQAGVWRLYGRTKVPLAGLSRAQVERAVQEHRPLQARLHLRDPHGRPATATLKPQAINWLE